MGYENKRNKTRQKIQSAFIDLYREKDIAHITVREICMKSSINRSTFYSFYTDVYELREQVEENCLGKLATMLAEEQKKSNGNIDIPELMTEVIQYSRQQDDLPILLIRRSDGSFIRRMTEFAKGILNEAVGPLEEEELHTIELGMQYHITGMAAMLSTWEERFPDRPRTDAIALLGRLANEGVATIFWKQMGRYKGT